MSGLQFKFSCLLTAMHYMVTTVGLELLRLGGVYEHRASPITPRLLLLVLLVGCAPAVNNLSLRYNNLGFYQVHLPWLYLLWLYLPWLYSPWLYLPWLFLL